MLSDLAQNLEVSVAYLVVNITIIWLYGSGGAEVELRRDRCTDTGGGMRGDGAGACS